MVPSIRVLKADQLAASVASGGMFRLAAISADQAGSDQVGVVNEFLGDGLLAFFNAPVPRETHPEDALRAALAIQERLRTAPFGVGIGIETGVATVGDPGLGGFVDFTCVGEPVNVASRLQALAEAGEVVIGPHAWRSVAELVEMRGISCQAQTVDLKGVGSVDVYRLRPLMQSHP